MQAFPKRGHRKAPLLKDVEVVFAHTCRNTVSKRKQGSTLEKRFTSKELTFSVASIRNIYHQNDFPKGGLVFCPSRTSRKETFTCLVK